ncbi:Low-density lipoprotein receptor-related protein 12 [Nymphon striatum]|nr:Low-density lipoprotein receptor-related protein 12 [Nymphon striatum]
MTCCSACIYSIGKLHIIAIIYLSCLISSTENYECVKNINNSPHGVITSPGYPHISSFNTNCTWYIMGQPNDVITIQFADVKLDDGSPDCKNSWIELGPAADKKSKRYCRSGYIPPSFISSKYRVWIAYHVSHGAAKVGSGFRLVYSVEPKHSLLCKPNQFHCRSGKCIPLQWTCNGRFECDDGSDEVNCKHLCTGNNLHCGDGDHCFNQVTEQCNGIWDCSNGADELGCGICKPNEFLCKSKKSCYDRHERCDDLSNCKDLSDELGCGQCKWNEIRCAVVNSGCYNPITEKCNGKFDCLRGEDETSCTERCPNKLQCQTGKGCYAPSQRCNSIANCADSSDERNCSVEVCKREIGGFLCKNKLCIRESWICDQTNDCGDYSDEEGCVKNSVITAAVMGALICGLLLVIAIGCTCKLYTLRIVEQRDLTHETPMSQIEREFMQREPPPPYAVAVGMPYYNQNQYSDHYRISLPIRPGRARSSRRVRRHHSRRRRAPSPPPPISAPVLRSPSNSGNHSPATSSSSIQISISEGEVMSSTVNTTLSGLDVNCDVNCDHSKEPKPVSSALLVLEESFEESISQPTVNKSDSSSVSSACSVNNGSDENHVQLETLSSHDFIEEDFITDDMQSLCAS